MVHLRGCGGIEPLQYMGQLRGLLMLALTWSIIRATWGNGDTGWDDVAQVEATGSQVHWGNGGLLGSERIRISSSMFLDLPWWVTESGRIRIVALARIS